MRTIKLEMQPEDYGNDIHAGPRGEDRMTRLVIPLPAGTASKIRSCVMVLSLDGAETRLSPVILPGTGGDAYIKGKLVYFVLRQEMTYCRALRVQLECYSDTQGKPESFICRTVMSERILFQPSIVDGLEGLPEARAEPSAISWLIGRQPEIEALLAGGGGDCGGWDEQRIAAIEQALNAIYLALQ